MCVRRQVCLEAERLNKQAGNADRLYCLTVDVYGSHHFLLVCTLSQAESRENGDSVNPPLLGRNSVSYGESGWELGILMLFLAAIVIQRVEQIISFILPSVPHSTHSDLCPYISLPPSQLPPLLSAT